MHHPLLELDKLDMQARELVVVVFPFQLAGAPFLASVIRSSPGIRLSYLKKPRYICLAGK